MKRLALLLLVFPLYGCFADQQNHLAQCELSGLKNHPGDGEAANQRNSYVSLCMSAKGYEYNQQNNKCGHLPNILDDFWHNPYCYAPRGRLARIVFRIETGEVDE